MNWLQEEWIHLTQALAWITFRSEEELDHYDPLNIPVKSIKAAFAYPTMEGPEIRCEGGAQLLLQHLRRGAIKAKGRYQDNGPVTDIPSFEWTSLSVEYDRSGVSADREVWWDKVIINTDDLLKHFPDEYQEKTPELKTQEWLEGQMRIDPEPQERPKSSFEEEAERLFGVGKRAFHRAWTNAIELTGVNWNKPGRKS
ncbi:hypothetical protein [Terasakiella pusilla]|uniref:hypothetical protein n=1 Tax=Terasakiella pusilla TaxID=64973 RepID=UPI003AA99D29